MQKKTIIVFVIFETFICFNSFCQDLTVGFEMGKGAYNMSDLKKINDLVLENLPFEAKITENYPNYWFLKPTVLLNSADKRFALGVTCSFQSTGSRISSHDYSGEYLFDSKVSSFSPGLIGELNIPLSKQRLSIVNELGFMFSKYSNSEYILVGDESLTTIYSYKSTNLYYQPSLRFSTPISICHLGIYLGYLFDLKKGDLLGEDSSPQIYVSNGKIATVAWEGFRVGVSVSIDLFKTVQ